MRFDELGLAPELVRAVKELGYDEPTPIQEMAIPEALAGKDVLGRAQTGTGKTAAFMLPTLQRLRDGDGLRALVLCPTRELAIQVAESSREYAKHVDLWVGVVYGGTSVQKDMRDLRAGYDMLVATPGRLIDHLERGNVDLSELEVLVLDEADRMLDMGFRPQINEILALLPQAAADALLLRDPPQRGQVARLRLAPRPGHGRGGAAQDHRRGRRAVRLPGGPQAEDRAPPRAAAARGDGLGDRLHPHQVRRRQAGREAAAPPASAPR